MNVQRIRNFLLRMPKPAKLRVSSGGEPQEIVIGRTSYAKHAETIAALNPELVECLDSSGGLLRALDLTAEEANRSDAASIPKGIESDPSALMLTHFANLIHRAYEHSMEVAFVKLVEMVERQGDRSEAIEARLERAESANRRLLQDQVEDAFARAEEKAEEADQGGLGQNLVSAFLSGQMQAPKGPGVVNGKAPTNGKQPPKKAD